MSKKAIEDLYEELLDKKELKNQIDAEIEELQDEIKKKSARKARYWRNKEEENLRSKIWRMQQKLNKMVENRGGKIDE